MKTKAVHVNCDICGWRKEIRSLFHGILYVWRKCPACGSRSLIEPRELLLIPIILFARMCNFLWGLSHDTSKEEVVTITVSSKNLKGTKTEE